MKIGKVSSAWFLWVTVIIVGCSTGPAQEEGFARKLRELEMADVTRWPNSILEGEMFPGGRMLPLSDNQARRLKSILLESRPAEHDPADSGRVISPAPRLCALRLAGQKWYFMPAGRPVSFVLPSRRQDEFERMMRVEFGLKD